MSYILTQPRSFTFEFIARSVVTLLLCVAFFSGGYCECAIGAEPISFRKQIAPILLEHCVACHGAKKAEGGYRLDSFQFLTQVGESGVAPVGHANVDANELLRRVVTADPSERMPADSEPLAPDAIAIIKQWLIEGGKYDGDTSTEPLWRAIPPIVYPVPVSSYPAPLPVTAVLMSLDGAQVYVSGYHEITVWNVSDGALVRRIANVPQRVHALAWGDDGKTLVVGGGTPGKLGEVRLYDLATGNHTQTIGRTTDVVLDLALNPQRTELAIAAADSMIRVVDLKTFAEKRVIASHADWVTAVCWSEDGSKIASASRDKSAKVFDSNTGDLLVSYTGHNAAVRGVNILTDGKQAVSVGADSKLHRWDVDGAKKVAEVGVGGDAFRLLRTEGMVFVPSTDKTVHQINLGTNGEAMAYKGHDDWVVSLGMHVGTQRLVTGSHSGEVRIWNTADGALIKNWIAKP